MSDFNIGCFGQHPDEPMESCLGCPNEHDCLTVTTARHAGPLKTGGGSSDVDTSAFQVTDSEPTATADGAQVEGNSVRSPDTGTFGIRKWFTNLRFITKGESKINLPDDLREMLSEHIEQAISVEHASRSSEHAAIAEKGRLFCTIRNVIQDYKKSNKKARLPVEFTVLFIAEKIFDRTRQTLYVWKRVWEAYGDSLKNMTDLTINKLDILTNLDKDKRDEWLMERTAKLIEMDETALKALVKKPTTRRAPQGEFINGYRMVPGKTGIFIRGLTELDKLRTFLGCLDQGLEQGEEEEQTVPLEEQRIAFLKEPLTWGIVKQLGRGGSQTCEQLLGIDTSIDWNEFSSYQSRLAGMRRCGLLHRDPVNGRYFVDDDQVKVVKEAFKQARKQKAKTEQTEDTQEVEENQGTEVTQKDVQAASLNDDQREVLEQHATETTEAGERKAAQEQVLQEPLTQSILYHLNWFGAQGVKRLEEIMIISRYRITKQLRKMLDCGLVVQDTNGLYFSFYEHEKLLEQPITKMILREFKDLVVVPMQLKGKAETEGMKVREIHSHLKKMANCGFARRSGDKGFLIKPYSHLPLDAEHNLTV